MSDTPVQHPAYLTQAAALRHAKIPVTRLHKLVATGLVRTKADPGDPIKYSAADLSKWMTESCSERTS